MSTEPAGAAELQSAIQEVCLPGVWSRGVALSRGASITADRITATEVEVRVPRADRPIAAKVSLWPPQGEDEGDWFCDCGDRANVCAHTVAALLAWRAGRLATPEEGPSAPPATALGRLEYRFTRAPGGLAFSRVVVYRDREVELTDTLVAYVGGVRSGRLPGPAPASAQEDFAVDSALGAEEPRPRGPLPRPLLTRLLAALGGITHVRLDGVRIEVNGRPARRILAVEDAPGGGFRIRADDAAAPGSDTEIFANGVRRVRGTLRALAEVTLPSELRPLLGLEGLKFSGSEAAALVTELLPRLQTQVELRINTTRLPRLVRETPRLELRLDATADGVLVSPVILYGEPAVAELGSEGLRALDPRVVPERSPELEEKLLASLPAAVRPETGRWQRFDGEAGARVTAELRHGEGQAWSLSGSGAARLGKPIELLPRLTATDTGEFSVTFAGPGGAEVDAAAVFSAWESRRAFIPLLEGGWAALPLDWLARFGERVEALLAARDPARKIPPRHRLEVARLLGEAGQDVPASLARFRERLETYTGLPTAERPADLAAELRPYQSIGVNWLHFLREAGLGAMLADDMGLGKTLQAICAIRAGRRTLVVCPTSVLQGWASQLTAFRPALRHATFHGAGRVFDRTTEVVLTTYALLRLEPAHFSEEWDAVILDESQTIRNPDSQVAAAAQGLRAGFRLALSGTPVENRPEDLWSQFQFLFPGPSWLGTREDFREQVESASGLARVRERVRPFILRRLKRDVAPELPARTEVVLECELSAPERETYDAVLAASRADARRLLDSPGASVFAVLETLLRLRQACCHPRLVPGATGESSAKLTLLVERLRASIDQGHRALVFSQWTSLLDLLEPRLQEEGLGFTRLDGSTPDRGAIVARFQDPAGPPVMLLSLKAGGVGLNLTAADHVYLLDPWWNPAVEDQAADRVHRIGQKNPVFVHRLIARETVEERILALQARKRELSGNLLEDGAAAAGLTREDLLELLG